MVRGLFLLFFVVVNTAFSQSYTFEDTLRGSVGQGRSWWDLLHYDLYIDVKIQDKFISGVNAVRFQVLQNSDEMQIDMQLPMQIDSVFWKGKKLDFHKKGKNAIFLKTKNLFSKGQTNTIQVYFSGNPPKAKRAPWDGGFSWANDSRGKPFVATSCQGLGASAWWPCKDHMYDEPDSMRIRVKVPAGLMDVSNGKFVSKQVLENKDVITEWLVKNPINNYGVNINIADYINFNETYQGEQGPLECSYYVLKEDFETAKIHFKDAARTLQAFEHWFGPYPFYEDGYKLVQVPYLGMEHQSSVTYGNKFKKGYLGSDLSQSGWGMKWDYIIVHESGHEWFANNITYKDIADMWIHESFTTYSEVLFTEYHYGKLAGQEYAQGLMKNIRNDKPIIGRYGVNQEGSSDMYSKGAAMVHTIRHIMNDDARFRLLLRGLNSDFYHKTVTTQEIEDYISKFAKMDLKCVFDQYLRTTQIPKLVVQKSRKGLMYRFENCIPSFKIPVSVLVDGKEERLEISSEWKKIKGSKLIANSNYYIK
ncbi:MAG: M1 family metallopeptidase [Leadbetterella sp.]